MRGIGRLARDSGLTVSALRFYDGAGVLVPAHVDPQSSYRWYSDEQVLVARLVARLRRVGMPVADIRRVVEHRDDHGDRGAGRGHRVRSRRTARAAPIPAPTRSAARSPMVSV